MKLCTQLKFAWCLIYFLHIHHLLAKSYYLHLTKLNWHSAFQACAVHDLQLATVNSQNEQNELENVVKTAGKEEENIWIGGTDLGRTNSYTWMASGKPFSYTHWTPGEPSTGGDEHCTHLWPVPKGSISWNNRPCSPEYYYICEDKASGNDNHNKNVNIQLTF